MDQRDLNLAEAAKRAAEHMPSKHERGAGVSAWDDFVEAFLVELKKDGYRIERFRGPAGAQSACE